MSSSSPSKEIMDVQIRAIENKINLYHQLKDQLYADIERYRQQGKEELVRILSASLE
ncbi:MAG: hypothetical protein M3114_04625 [Thermoproteota archaeon]|jgi:hypothetical protein|nr:hypothetical protein [Thermoproteota archaeon]MDQ4066851.1 hypothetical protein [Thermoproteota archaeon]